MSEAHTSGASARPPTRGPSKQNSLLFERSDARATRSRNGMKRRLAAREARDLLAREARHREARLQGGRAGGRGENEGGGSEGGGGGEERRGGTRGGRDGPRVPSRRRPGRRRKGASRKGPRRGPTRPRSGRVPYSRGSPPLSFEGTPSLRIARVSRR